MRSVYLARNYITTAIRLAFLCITLAGVVSLLAATDADSLAATPAPTQPVASLGFDTLRYSTGARPPWLPPGERSTAQSSSELFASPNERFGFGVTSDINDFDVGLLQAGWYVNWDTASEAPHPAGLEYAQIIRLRYDGTSTPSQTDLTLILQNNPGLTWIIGNEPDCPYQDNVHPSVYAPTYHDLYHFLKGQDPTCKVAIGGVVQATPLRLQYLDMVWEAYQALYGERMPVDIWNVHNFILREKRDPPDNWGSSIPPGIPAAQGELREMDDHDRMDLFDQQIRAFRAWMAEKGERDKPLIITEYGILFNEELGFGEERVREFMLATFDYSLTATDPDIGYPADGNRLVQRWAWYSLDDDSFEWGTTWGNLFDPTTREIESLGQAFGNYVVAHDLITPYHDLRPMALTLHSADSLVYGQPATLTLSSRVMNWGNASTGPFAVRLLDGESLLGESTVPGLGPRYEEEAVVNTSWSDFITTSRAFRVVVDSAHQVDEWKEDNNTTTLELNVDLAVALLDSSAPFVQPGQTTDITVTAQVSNLGDVAIHDVVFELRDGSNGDRNRGIIGTSVVPELTPGAEHEVSLVWADRTAGCHPVVAIVDPEDVIIESDEANNEARGTALVPPCSTFLPLVADNSFHY